MKKQAQRYREQASGGWEVGVALHGWKCGRYKLLGVR